MKAAIFDTETTGIPKHPDAKMDVQPRIIEFGCLIIDHEGVEHDRLNLIIDPEEEIEPIITKITGLTNEDLRGKPKFHEVLPQIAAIIGQADLLVAHNLPFDHTMLSLELDRELLRAGGRPEFPWPELNMCTVQENFLKYGKRPRLIELYRDVMGKELEQTHRALDDCRALAEVVIKEGYINAYRTAAKS